MGLFSWIGSLFTPVNEVLKNIDVSGNDKRKLENAFAEMQATLYTQVVELEKAKLDAHAKIIHAEAASNNKLQSSWRPILSITLVLTSCILAFYLGDLERIFELTMVLVTGHYGGRSLEKIANVVKLKK